jgi:hypothetical protein
MYAGGPGLDLDALESLLVYRSAGLPRANLEVRE